MSAHSVHKLSATASIALIWALAFTCFAFLAPQADAAGVVAAYSFDEGSGTTAHDLAGNPNHGTIEGATWTEAGKYGAALSFDGADDLITIPDADELDLTEGFTLEAWVRPDTLGAWTPVLAKDDVGPLTTGYLLFADAWERPRGFIGDNGGAANAAGTSPLPTEETWSHLAFTHDGVNLRLYVDGQLEGTTPTSLSAAATASDLKIAHSSTFSTYFDGLIDEVRIFDRALDQGEIEVTQERPINPSLLKDILRHHRHGSANNTNFDHDGIDDYRVDANIAVFTTGIWKDGVPDPQSETLRFDLAHRADCVNPDPFREALGEYQLPDIENTTPDPEAPFWVPNSALNEEHQSSHYGCLENWGEPLSGQAPPSAVPLGNSAAMFEGILLDDGPFSDQLALGGIAPGARVWSVRTLPTAYNFGAYPAPFTFPTRFHGEGLGPISSPGLPLTCGTGQFEAPTWVGPARKLTIPKISVKYNGCKTTDEAKSPATVEMNSCTYTLHVSNADDPYEGTLDIACAKVGDEIEIDVYAPDEEEVICTETIPPQKGLEGIDLYNNGKDGAEKAIEIDAAVQGIEYGLSEGCGESPEEKSDGTLSAETILYGESEKEEPVGIFVMGFEVDDPIEEGLLSPGIGDETEWNSDYGVSYLIAGLDWVIATKEDADPENDVDVVDMISGCARDDDPEVQEAETGGRACDSTALDAKIREAMDHGIVVVEASGEFERDLKAITPMSTPDVLTVTVVADCDDKPGGKSPSCNDDRRWSKSNFGLAADITFAGGPIDSGTTSPAIAGAVATLASQCPASDRAGIEYVVDTLMAEGDTGEIAEGGWHDDSGDGWKEPLLNLHDEEVFDPVMIDTETGERNHEPDEDGCPWRSHQAESDVDSDGRADLIATGGGEEAAEVAEGAYEGPEGEPARAGFEVAEATASLEGQTDPALLDGEGSYAIDSADVDGDRNADLIAAGAEGGVSVYPGEGGGGTEEGDAGFGEAVSSLSGTTLALNDPDGEIELIAAADVDSDGHADLIAHQGSTGKILTYRGQASGKFESTPVKSGSEVDSALWDNEGGYFIDAIDVTGEELNDPEPEEGEIDYYAKHSYADLIVSDTDGTVYLYPGQGDAGFGEAIEAAEVNPAFDDGTGEEIVGLGDIDRDRRADLLTLAGQTLKLRRGQKDGSFAEASEPYEGDVNSSLLDGEGEELIGLLDYSRDGLADLVSVKEDGTVLAYTAQRDKTLAAPVAQEGSLPSIRNDEEGYEFSAHKPLTRRAGCSASGCHWPFEPNPPRLEADAYPATLSGTGPLAISGLPNPIECEETALEGELEAPAASIEL
ncbi:MAG TPA: LamG-like jellyroll fold domain-containing protein, partial [Solirubrobacterales bacterium]|nr:LamG-like jellyroll fold domain-containing protein [Solirubrobacterales bacterium]